MRSGIVSLTGPDDTDPVGLPQNATLHFTEGSGVHVSRTQTSFNFALAGSHHNNDVENFAPGYAYSFFDIENNVSRSGTVGAEAGTISFFELFFIRDGVRLIFRNGAGDFSTDTTNASNKFAFRTYGANPNDPVPTGDPDSANSHGELFPDDTADPPQDYIIYCQRTTSPTNTPEATILAVDPPVGTAQALGAIMGAPTDGDRNPFSVDQVFTAFSLQEHHNTPIDPPADWALTNNTDINIPTDKLRGLDDPALTGDPDNQTAFRIDNSWLEDSVLDDSYVTTPTAGQRLVYRVATADDPAGWYNEAGTLSNLTDVNATAPTAGHILEYRDADGSDPAGWYGADNTLQNLTNVTISTTGDTALADGHVLTWDTTTNMWINESIPDAGIDLTQGTETVGPDFRGNFVQIQQPVDPAMPDAPRINFVAMEYIVPAAQFSISGNQTPSLFGGTTSASFALGITNWDGTNAPVVRVTNSVGTGSIVFAANTDANTGGSFNITGLDPTTLNTYSFDFVVEQIEGTVTTQRFQGTRTVTFTDIRSLEFTAGPTVFAANSAVDYIYQVTQRNGLVVQDGDYEVRLNNVVISSTANRSGSILRSDANWVLGNNTVSITGTDEQLVPSITRNVTRNVTTVRPYYFWQQDTEVTQTDDFDGEVLQTFSAGRSLTASTAGTWWLAYPMDLGTFQYRTMRGGLIVTPTVSSRFFLEPFFGILDTTDARRRYTVLEFTGVSAGTTFDVETP